MAKSGQKIEYEQFLAIKKALSEGMTESDISKLSGVSVWTVSQIKTGKHSFCETKAETPANARVDLAPTVEAVGSLKTVTEEGQTAIVEQLKTLNDTLTRVHTALCRLKIDSEKIANDVHALVAELKG